MTIQKKYPSTVGRYLPASDGQKETIERAPYGQGYIYKNWEVFSTDPSAVCYIPELSDTAYTGQDFLELCKGNAELAKELFYFIDWQHPETAMDEWFREEEIRTCPDCGMVYSCGEGPACPKCGMAGEEANN